MRINCYISISRSFRRSAALLIIVPISTIGSLRSISTCLMIPGEIDRYWHERTIGHGLNFMLAGDMQEGKRIRSHIQKCIDDHKNTVQKVWEGIEEGWKEVYEVIENKRCEITNRNRGDERNADFFTKICEKWTDLFKNKSAVQKEFIKELGGFKYGLAIMLINSQELFNDNIEPLRSLLAAAGMDDFCNLNSKEAMNKKGIGDYAGQQKLRFGALIFGG